MKVFTEEEALKRAAASCSCQELCRADVEDRLLKWNMSHEAAERILARLEADNFLNEERYCRAFINDKLRFAKWGKQKIAGGLRLKQVSYKLAWQLLEEVDREEYLAVLRDIIASKRKSIRAGSEYELNAKLVRFALSRGFEMKDICLYVQADETADETDEK